MNDNFYALVERINTKVKERIETGVESGDKVKVQSRFFAKMKIIYRNNINTSFFIVSMRFAYIDKMGWTVFSHLFR